MTRSLLAVFLTFVIAAPASAAKCGGDFNAFMAGMARDAQAAGVSNTQLNQ